MTTEKDLNTLNLSPTNKDYYQVWSELIETAGKLSERWDPASTNESDPGIVLLKVLTAIADKINYNIDKNILEAFMPTAAQAESMKRLCDMLGYHVGYYESATTDVTIRYVGNTYTLEDNPERLPDGTDDRGIGLVIPAFTVLHNEDKTIYYSTTQEARLTNEETFITVPCIEGQRILSETNTGNVVTLNNLDSNNRYYLPEIQIAENGIFVYGTAGGLRTTTWKKVNNLNIIPNDTKAYSFGFDSKENRPYLQFPNDIGLLIEDGLEIYYIRTSGAAGNISARTLTALEKPTDGAWKDYSDNEKFVVNNPDAALNGKNPENIEQAYNGFKKTIGTFDTLVTCRDYINKIYQLVDEQNNELVSNVIVSDIRDDINRAHVLCSFSDYGIIYVEKANAAKASTVVNSTLDNQGIDHFDLVIYPFKAYRRLHDAQDFKNSFTYSDTQMPLISAQLADIKSIAHSYSTPVGKEITCIKNYLKLNARISTINKVNSAEESLILNNIKKALFEKFNMRELDFGEEIPYEAILKCMETADTKIKSVALDEPILYTKFATQEGEFDIASVGGDKTGRDLYNKLALRNILAGRVELFRYDSAFKVELGEALYPTNDYSPIYPETTNKPLTRIVTECKKDLTPQYTGNYVTLKANEVVKFRAPSLKTLTPYSAYVNYHLILNQKVSEPAEPARFLSIGKLWSLPIDLRVANTDYIKNGTNRQDLSIWEHTECGKFTNGSYDFYLFGSHFMEFLQGEDYLETFTSNKNDFAQIGQVKAVGMVNTDGIPLPSGWTPPTTITDTDSCISDLMNIKNSDGEAIYSESISALQTARDAASAQLSNYSIAAKQCALYYPDATGHLVPLFSKEPLTETALTSLVDNGTTGNGEVGDFYVIELKNTNIVFLMLSSWAKTFGSKYEVDMSLTDEDLLSSEKQPYKLISSGVDVYRNIGANTERLPGKQVDKLRNKYMPATQPDISQASGWNSYFWPAPRCRQIEGDTPSGMMMELSSAGWCKREFESNKFDEGYAKTSMGTDMKVAGIQPLEEYQLKENEYLFINYTPASTSSASDQATSAAVEPLNICHGPGTIIKPNAVLTLHDSNTWHSMGAHNWAKTAGFDFSAFSGGQDIEGMYSIGPNEQIDIRDFIEVTLSEPSYMYWMLNESITLSATGDTPPYYNSYTLQDGEYIFYTDKNKLDMAYYGAGTELRIEGTGTRKFAFKTDITQVNLEDVLLHGVSAIPWKMITLETNNYIVLREFQYLTLTKGDSFRGLVLDTAQTKDYLDNEWTMVDADSPCYYTLAGEKTAEGGTPLPKFNFIPPVQAEGTPMRGTGIGWEVRSFLELNMGPDEAQLLNEGNAIYLYSDSESLLVSETTAANGSIIKTPASITPKTDANGNIIPLAIKTNIALQSPGGDVNLYGANTTAAEIDQRFAIKLKVFEDAPIATISGEVDDISTTTASDVEREFIQSFKNETTSEDLSLYNFNTLWTLLAAEDFISNAAVEDDSKLYSWVRMHANVPDNHYNIMMLYYQAPETNYEFGQGMGFRFYTYKDAPTITLQGQSKQIMQDFYYNGHRFNVNGVNIECNMYLDTADEIAGDKSGMVIIDNKNVVFRYKDAVTGQSFEDIYNYTIDHSEDSIILYEIEKNADGTYKPFVPDSENIPTTLKANIKLKDGAANNTITSAEASESFDTIISRGIKFKNLKPIADKVDIIGIYDATARVDVVDTKTKVDKVEIRYDRINLYQKATGEPAEGDIIEMFSDVYAPPHSTTDKVPYKLLKTWYYTYELDTNKNKIVNLYTDSNKETQIKSPFIACVDFGGVNDGLLSIIDNYIAYELTPEQYCSVSGVNGDSVSACNGDTAFFGEYQAGSFCETLFYSAQDGVININSYGVSADNLKTDTCTYVINTDIVTGESKVTVTADRFLLDTKGEHIRIFNNISLTDLNDFLSDSYDRAQLFDDYFKKLHWWKQSDLGYLPNDTDEVSPDAFGNKAIASYAELANYYEEDENKGKTNASMSGGHRYISDVYFLKPGLNIITFRESGKFEFFPEIDASGALFISDIDSIERYSADLGLNIETIDYQCSGTDNDLADRRANKIAYKLLYDIKAKDPNNEFYYNCPLQSATALDINTLLTGDDKEYLSDPKFWYEPNNINNKFVISQIDADYLDEGLVITKASKLR